MRPDFRVPPKLRPGDRVAVVSPSFAAPALFPAVHEQALRRIRSELGLEPVEFPTTRRFGAAPADRAADLMAAFADPEIRAVFATIGGDDQITVLPHLDPAPFVADPKPFFGFSDNTNLLNWLWNHGVAARSSFPPTRSRRACRVRSNSRAIRPQISCRSPEFSTSSE